MKFENLQDLFVDLLRDLFDAEVQVEKALPKLERASSHTSLKQVYVNHLEQTKTQQYRLQQIFDFLDVRPTGKTCRGMEGIIKESEEFINEKADPDVRDAGIIAAAQKVEHYEISGYGTARTFAEKLGYTEAVHMLQQSLDEEKQVDVTLTSLAENSINSEAQAS